MKDTKPPQAALRRPPKERRRFNSGALIYARRRMGWQQGELADLSDCHRNTVYNAEAGRCTPKQAARFAKALAECARQELAQLHQWYARATGDWRRAAIAKRIGELSHIE